MKLHPSCFLTFCLASLIVLTTSAQNPEIWGTTRMGGKGFGTIFKLDENGDNHKIQHEFGGITLSGAHYTEFIEVDTGVLFGTFLAGGSYDYGGILEYNYKTKKYHQLHYFYPEEGYNSGGSLTIGPNGNVFGTNTRGGSGEVGTIWEYNRATETFTDRISFDTATIGYMAQHGLLLASDGYLYGVAGSKWFSKTLYIFRYDPVTHQMSTLYNTTDSVQGFDAQARLMQASNGKLYGTTFDGGIYNSGYSFNLGTIFEFDLTDSSYKVLHHFDGPKGSRPRGSLIEVGNGRLFGMAAYGGINNQGVFYEYNLSLDTFICHIRFDGGNTGAKPLYNNLMLASNGKIYGLTKEGGSSGEGALFEFDPADTTFKVKHSFSSLSVGKLPGGTLMQASDGKLYGVTTNATSQGRGAIFSYNISSGQMTLLDKFHDESNGNGSIGKLLRHSNGLLYGISGAGEHDNGVLYSFHPVTKVYKVEYHFIGTEGHSNLGALLEGDNGVIYGTTRYGGNSSGWGDGTLYSYDPGQGVFKVEVLFNENNIGSNPEGGLISNSSGIYYGLLSTGGNHSSGTIYSFNPAKGEAKKIHDFDQAAYGRGGPMGELTELPNGLMYGINKGGGIFSLNPYNNKVEMLSELSAAITGTLPFAGLSPGPDNLLYGTTFGGGSKGGGTLFSFNPISLEFKPRINFGYEDSIGRAPHCKPLWASNNKMYVTTRWGGASPSEYGTIYEYDPATDISTKKLDFLSTNGKEPTYALTELFGLRMSVDESNKQHQEIKVYPNPSNGMVEVSFETNQTALYVELIEIQGAVLNRWTFYNTDRASIDISDYAEGIYLLRVSTKGKSETIRIVKGR